ncbi:MAG TPA: hypothetical protein PKZ77_00335, partial [Pseudomonadales bacterium]|nr:hypothetical protein [Pseudomonadales bacterium]
MTIPREQTQQIIDTHRAATVGILMRTDYLVPDAFEEQAARLGERAALIYEDEVVSWQELEARSAH